MEAVVARGVQVLLALGGAYRLALWFVLIVWTFRDIETRSRSVITQVFSTLLAVLFYVPGVLLYMILRPKETLDSAFQRSLEEEYLLQDLEELPLCPKCQHYVEEDYKLCPNCQTTLRENCHECGRLVDLQWTVRPFCGADQSKGEEHIALPKPVERWIAPSIQQRVEKRTGPRFRCVVPAPAWPKSAPPRPWRNPGKSPRVPVRLFDRRKTRELARQNGCNTLPLLPPPILGPSPRKSPAPKKPNCRILTARNGRRWSLSPFVKGDRRGGGCLPKAIFRCSVPSFLYPFFRHPEVTSCRRNLFRRFDRIGATSYREATSALHCPNVGRGAGSEGRSLTQARDFSKRPLPARNDGILPLTFG